jgi:hypothetical protein
LSEDLFWVAKKETIFAPTIPLVKKRKEGAGLHPCPCSTWVFGVSDTLRAVAFGNKPKNQKLNNDILPHQAFPLATAIP